MTGLRFQRCQRQKARQSLPCFFIGVSIARSTPFRPVAAAGGSWRNAHEKSHPKVAFFMPERITSSRAQQREQPEQQVRRPEQQQRQQREQPGREQRQEREQRREQQPALPSYRKQPGQQQRSRLPERGICSFGLPNELKTISGNCRCSYLHRPSATARADCT